MIILFFYNQTISSDTRLGLSSRFEFDTMIDQYYNSEYDTLIKTSKGFDMKGINDYLCDVRDYIESEIVEYLEKRGLAKAMKSE